jgi:phospholipid transport system substrate-binding protein
MRGRRAVPEPPAARSRSRRLTPAALVLLAAGLLAAPGPALAGPATSVVEELHRMLASHLRPPARSFDERLERLEPMVGRSFDFETITRVALGSAYGDLDAAGQARFQDMMRRLSALTYAERFDLSDDAPRFVTVSEQPARRGRILVRTRLERSGDDPVALDYVLQGTPEGPRIVNVLAEGVSDLSLKRAEYAAVIRKEGIAELERRLREQVDALAERGRSG